MDLVQVNGITGSWNPVEEVGAQSSPHVYALGKGYCEAYPLSGVILPRAFAERLQRAEALAEASGKQPVDVLRALLDRAPARVPPVEDRLPEGARRLSE